MPQKIKWELPRAYCRWKGAALKKATWPTTNFGKARYRAPPKRDVRGGVGQKSAKSTDPKIRQKNKNSNYFIKLVTLAYGYFND